VSPDARQAVEWAHRIVTLQPLAGQELRSGLRAKVRPIVQSATAPRTIPLPLRNRFEVCVSGHLRPVKDPFRAAEAARLLPPESRIQVTQVGASMSADMEKRARKEMAENPRFKWSGQREPWEARRLLARSKLLLVTSLLEGGANVVSEAIAAGVPVIHSRIPGAVGILGEDYPGYFEVGDTGGLARMLRHAEVDSAFYASLQKWCRDLQPMVAPEKEREGWRLLLHEIGVQ
jgi:glycosyltransferase involved in cell wall biosynthesis